MFFYTEKYSIKIYTCTDICIDNTVLSMLGFCPAGLLSVWAFVCLCKTAGLLSGWAFVRLGFCPPLQNRWAFVRWVFVRLGFCPLGFCPYPRLHSTGLRLNTTIAQLLLSTVQCSTPRCRTGSPIIRS